MLMVWGLAELETTKYPYWRAASSCTCAACTLRRPQGAVGLHRRPEQVALRREEAWPRDQVDRLEVEDQVRDRRQIGTAIPRSRTRASGVAHRQGPLLHQRQYGQDPSRLLRHRPKAISLPQGHTREVRLHPLHLPAGGWRLRSGPSTTT